MHVLGYGAESREATQCIKRGNACIKIWSRVNVLRYVMHVLRYGLGCFCHIFWHCATIFGTVRFFGKKLKKFWVPTARAYNYYARGYFITRADIVLT